MAEKNNCVYGVAYGKLYLAGEYAILENESSALLIGVDKNITVSITPSLTTRIKDNFYNEEVLLTEENKNFMTIQKFIHFINNYTKRAENFSLTIENNLQQNGIKYGFGSSGALLVAITRAMFNFYKIKISDEEIFKLVVIFNLKNNIKGSMGDVATSLHRGITYYKKFNTNYVLAMLEEKTIFEVVKSKWSGLVIKKITPNVNIEIIAKWTGCVVDTNTHIKKWQELEKERYKKFVTTSNTLVEKLTTCFEKNNIEETFNVINKIRENLLFLEKISAIQMETNKAKNWFKNFKAGKQSGSGSGDMILGFRESDNFKITLDLDKLEEKEI